MPLTPQYTWEETKATVSITITAPGLTKAKSDLLISDTYVSVNCPPYLLQLDLAHAVDDTDGSALFGAQSLVLRLNKVSPGLWGQLAAQGSKMELQQRRDQSQQRLERRLESRKQAQLNQKKAMDKAATDRRMELDRQKRDAIERYKQQELETQRAQVTSWQSEVAAKDEGESDYEDEEDDENPASSGQDRSEYHGKGWKPKKARAVEPAGTISGLDEDMHSTPPEQHNTQLQTDRQAIWEEQPSDEATEPVTESEHSIGTVYDQEPLQASRDEADSSAAHTAPVRSACLPVAVEFTKLETEHLPARETREQEISSYKRKAQDSKAAEDSVDMSERQPMFLKDKADAMHRAGNYRAAVNAYAQAVQIDASMTVCYSNRAASYLKLKEFRRCIEDCTTALAQTEAAMGSSAAGSSAEASALHSSMVKLFTRRAAAHVELQDLAGAKADLTEALLRSPHDKRLQADLREIEACQRPVDSNTLRSLADERFKSQDLQGATDAYTALLALPDAAPADRLAAASNRAACSLAQRSYSNSVDDCNLALAMLAGRNAQAASDVFDVHAWITLGEGVLTDKQKESLCRLLARRGVALGQLARCALAVRDLQAAQEIYKSLGLQAKADALKADIEKMQRMANTM